MLWGSLKYEYIFEWETDEEVLPQGSTESKPDNTPVVMTDEEQTDGML